MTFMAGAAHAACSAPAGNAAEIVYNDTDKSFQYCDGTDWILMGRGSASGGCTGPARGESAMVYNEDNRVMQGCAGNVWAGFGKNGGGAGGASQWVQVSVGGDFSCGIKGDGTLWCWGREGNGQLGDGASTSNQSSPVQEASASTNWTQMDSAPSGSHSCAVKTDGTLWCWGLGSSGQMGNGGSATTNADPVQESGAATNWIQATTGGSHSCGIKELSPGDGYGEIWCWGSDASEQLGDGAGATNQSSPVQVGTDTDWAQVSGGGAHTCAIKTNGTLWCWGNDASEQLGDGAGATNQSSPVQEVNGWTDWAQVDAGGSYLGDHTCAVKTDGTLWCWGEGGGGRLGSGTTDRNSPNQVGTGTDWAQVDAGPDETFVVKTDGTLWGLQSTGPYQVGSKTDWVEVSNDDTTHKCARRTNGTIGCWATAHGSDSGRDLYGEFGNGSDSGIQVSPVQEATKVTNWAQIGVGKEHSCAVKTDGTLWCWGRNVGGSTPTQESSSGTTWKQTSVGWFTCAVKTDGTLWCWGSEWYGRLGNGTAGTTSSPDQEFHGWTTWKQVSAGLYHGCAVKELTLGDGYGELYCWGSDQYGQVGNGATTGDQDSPVQVGTDQDWFQVANGDYHSCAIKEVTPGDGYGELYCWGRDHQGQLGDGADSNEDEPSPVLVGTDTDWVQVNAGNAHTCAVKTDGTLWCWGNDSWGKLGNGGAGGQDVPDQEATSATDWKQVSAGWLHTCAVKTDNTLWCWGSDYYGEIGDGGDTGSSNSSPLKIGSDWSEVGAGEQYTCAITLDGKVYCWGSDEYGRLGTGVDTSTPSSSTWCGAPARAPGSLFYNGDYNTLQYCDGVGWVAIGKADSCLAPSWTAFTDLTNQTVSTSVTSNIRLVTGDPVCSYNISISGTASDEEYRICSDSGCSTEIQTWGSAAGTINDGEYLQLRMTTAGTNATTLTAVPDVGGVADTWSTTTPCDTAPDAFIFTDVTGATTSTVYTSDIKQITGIDTVANGCGASISIAGTASDEQYRICDDGTCSADPAWTSSSGTVDNGQWVQVKLTSSATAGQTYNATLTVGSGSDTYDVTTAPVEKYVFVTSGSYNGSTVASVANADSICSTAGSGLGSGTYKAWISDSNAANDPQSRFTGVSGFFRYKLQTGTVIADGWSDLTDGTLSTAIDRDEGGNLVSAANNVWTNVNTSGMTEDTGTTGKTNHCVDWTSGASNKDGGIGSSNATDSTWTDGATNTCDGTLRLYCFEQ